MCFFFNDTATTEIYTLSLHDALPICQALRAHGSRVLYFAGYKRAIDRYKVEEIEKAADRSEEHTSELQSRQYLVCRLLLEKKKTPHITSFSTSLLFRRTFSHICLSPL